VKHQTAPVPRTWVACDSSEVFLSDTTWEHSRWQPVCVEPVSGEPAEVDVTGISCGFDTITPAAMLPSGIAEGDVIAFLATGGVPLVVELGASLDVLLAVLVLQVLTGRMRTKFGDTDLNRLRELHD